MAVEEHMHKPNPTDPPNDKQVIPDDREELPQPRDPEFMSRNLRRRVSTKYRQSIDLQPASTREMSVRPERARHLRKK